jgi:hypothetical protein
MSISAISSSLASYGAQATESPMKKLEQDLKQLGQDLKSGNLTAAQSDFVTLQQDLPQSSSSSATGSSATGSSTSSDPIAKAFQQLGTDLQSGNLTAAQQDFSTIKQDLQGAEQSVQGHHHHHHGGGDQDSASSTSSSSSSSQSAVSQLFSQLGTELESGDLSGAQATYTSMEKDFQQSQASASSSSSASSTSAASTGVSVQA